jgi:hypothetical protein
MRHPLLNDIATAPSVFPLDCGAIPPLLFLILLLFLVLLFLLMTEKTEKQSGGIAPQSKGKTEKLQTHTLTAFIMTFCPRVDKMS